MSRDGGQVYLCLWYFRLRFDEILRSEIFQQISLVRERKVCYHYRYTDAHCVYLTDILPSTLLPTWKQAYTTYANPRPRVVSFKSIVEGHMYEGREGYACQEVTNKFLVISCCAWPDV